jgi:ribosomal protein L32E
MFKINTIIKRRPEYPYIGYKRDPGKVIGVRPGGYAEPKYVISWSDGTELVADYDYLSKYYMLHTPYNKIWVELNA